jgi:hydroxypyruvate isomerase
MKLAANLSWMYRDLPWADRFDAAARDGFQGVEILLPYDEPPDWYAHRLCAHGLQLVLLNTPVTPGAGRLGLAAIPGATDEFRHDFERARAIARATGCRRIHVMAGDITGRDAAECREALLRNLEYALEVARHDGIVLTLEALNRADMPGYFYHLPSQVMAILRYFDSPQLRLQFDFYHCVKEALDPRGEVQVAAPWIGHVQIAGAEGRHEPDLSRDGLLDAVAALPALGYDSWLGCEYQPRSSAAAGLAWCEPLRRSAVLQ